LELEAKIEDATKEVTELLLSMLPIKHSVQRITRWKWQRASETDQASRMPVHEGDLSITVVNLPNHLKSFEFDGQAIRPTDVLVRVGQDSPDSQN